MPIPAYPDVRLPRPDRRATLETMPGTDVPVIRQPFVAGDRLPFWAGAAPPRDTLLFDTDLDPDEAGEPGDDTIGSARGHGRARRARAGRPLWPTSCAASRRPPT